jgi:VanZ family protein
MRESGAASIIRRCMGIQPWSWIAAIFAVQTVGALFAAKLLRLQFSEVALPIGLLIIGAALALSFRHFDRSGGMGLWKWWLPPGIYALFIFFLSSRSYTAGAISFETSLFHPVEYMTLGILLSWARHPLIERKGTLTFVLAVLSSGLLLGLFDEIHQHFVPGRTMSFYDLCLDLLGLIVGTGLFLGTRLLHRVCLNQWNAVTS